MIASRLLLAAAALLAGLAPALLARAEDTYDIRPKPVKGLRRTATIERRRTLEGETRTFETVTGRMKSDRTLSALVHDWVAALHADAGPPAPARVVRTYERLKASETSEFANDLVPTPLVSTDAPADPRRRQTLVLDVARDGALTVASGAERIISEHDRQAVVDDLELDLFPDGPVQVGATWTLPKERLAREPVFGLAPMPKFLAPPPPTLESGTLAVTLVSVASDDRGRPVARLGLAGQATYRDRRQDMLGTVTHDVTTEVTLAGHALIDLEAGRLLERRLEGKLAQSGPMLGGQLTARGTVTDVRTYAYGYLFDDAPAPFETAVPATVATLETTPWPKVAAEHLVLLQAPSSGARLSVFDPAARKLVKTLVAFPAGLIADQPALAPGGDRVAFSSTLNNDISIAPFNVFVLETATGKLHQVTPRWATGDGLAQPLETKETGSVSGRISWYDAIRRLTRSDCNFGSVRVDQSRKRATIGVGGGFLLENVPVGALVLYAEANVTAGDGARGRETLRMGGTHVALSFAGKTNDGGAVSISSPAIVPTYANAAWLGEKLVGSTFGTNRTFEAGYPARSYAEGEIGKVFLCGSLSASPDGKMLAVVENPTGGAALAFHDATTRAPLHRVVPPKPDPDDLAGATFLLESGAAWLPDSSALAIGGFSVGALGIAADVPTLFVVEPATGRVRRKEYPEWVGRKILDVTTDRDGRVFYFVVHWKPDAKGLAEGDVFRYEPATDTTTRITGVKDVLAIAGHGR